MPLKSKRARGLKPDRRGPKVPRGVFQKLDEEVLAFGDFFAPLNINPNLPEKFAGGTIRFVAADEVGDPAYISKSRNNQIGNYWRIEKTVRVPR